MRRVRLRAHRAARRACLRATPAYATPAHATPACAMPAKPPSSHRPNSHALACHLVSATAQPACLRDALRLRDTATPRTCHPVPPCDPDSAPTVLALSRRAARMACHRSPLTRGEPSLQSSPTLPCLGHAASRRHHLHCIHYRAAHAHTRRRSRASLLLTRAWVLCCQAFATYSTPALHLRLRLRLLLRV